MDSPYEPTISNFAPRQGSSLRRFVGLAFAGVAGFAVLVCALNVIGHNLYLYINVGSNDLIFGGGCGVSHTAIAPHTDFSELSSDLLMQPYEEMFTNLQTDIVKVGPFHVFAERRIDPFQPLRFDFVNGDQYSAVEVPLLLVTGFFGTIGGVLIRGRRDA
ncbi:MAG: hypothetical protein KDB00_17235 [Planctomycetales bacterium]|nr:hypothetical protein [Planctomycetales bacterium]